jgi:hypothetical protein
MASIIAIKIELPGAESRAICFYLFTIALIFAAILSA